MGKPFYWEGTGKWQDVLEDLTELLPAMGEAKGKSLNKMRVAQNCYYDLFNNGLCNRAEEFRRTFGFGGTHIAKNGFPYTQKLEEKMDEIVFAAGIEQKHPRILAIVESERLSNKITGMETNRTERQAP